MSPVPRAVSKNQVNRLGDRLRDGSLTDEDRSFLEAVRSHYFECGFRVANKLMSIGYQPVWRLKSLQTTEEKLRRQPRTPMSRIQDLAGARIVGDWDRIEQDRQVERIRGAFADWGAVRITDRRSDPTHGYRAVHVIVRVDGWPVEIQVRTPLQDAWANTQEKLADLYGRGIRYGEAPDNGAAAPLLDIMQRLSNSIDRVEKDRAELARSETELEILWDITGSEELGEEGEALLEELSDRIERFKGQVEHDEDMLKRTLESLDDQLATLSRQGQSTEDA